MSFLILVKERLDPVACPLSVGTIAKPRREV